MAVHVPITGAPTGARPIPAKLSLLDAANIANDASLACTQLAAILDSIGDTLDAGQPAGPRDAVGGAAFFARAIAGLLDTIDEGR